MARPPRNQTRASRRIEFRVTEAEYAEIHRLAQLNDARIGEWCRFACLAAAGDVGEAPPIVVGGVLEAFAIVQRG